MDTVRFSTVEKTYNKADFNDCIESQKLNTCIVAWQKKDIFKSTVS